VRFDSVVAEPIKRIFFTVIASDPMDIGEARQSPNEIATPPTATQLRAGRDDECLNIP
jgi:hypothetical protein